MPESIVESWSRMRVAALDSVSTLKELLDDRTSDDRRLVLGYLEAKKCLAHAFEAFAAEKYADPAVFDDVKALLENAMRATFTQIPEKYLRVRGFGRVHEVLLAYLSTRAGLEVTAEELRMLTGDAVHTERRARDLRDLGFRLNAYEQGGAQVYVLESSVPDVAAGVALLVARNIRSDRSLVPTQSIALLERAGLS